VKELMGSMVKYEEVALILYVKKKRTKGRRKRTEIKRGRYNYYLTK
jgi:hypothetical protein